MKRKDFVQLSAFATAAISFPLLQSCSPSAVENLLSKPVFLSRLFDKKTISETGKAYILKTADENDADKLILLLAGNSSIADSRDETVIHRYLDEKVKQDFETGNIILIKGWVLSVTEARQCALFWLVNS
jgi:hypothetical protein